jgi:predicted PurR-regulated permease PerM
VAENNDKKETSTSATTQLIPREELVKTETVVETKTGEMPVVFTQFTASSWLIVRAVLITLLIIYVAGLVTSLFVLLEQLLFLLILSVSFAYLMQPLIGLVSGFYEKIRGGGKAMPRALSIAISYLIVFSILGIGIAAIAPLAAEQGREFSENLPGYATTVQEKFNSVSTSYRYRLPKSLQDSITERLTTFAGNVGERVTGTLGELFIALVYYLPWLVLVPILAFFFLKDINLFRVSLLRLLPHGNWRTRIEAVLDDFNKTLAAYARAQLISCVLIGLLCTAGFYLIGLNYAILLGILAGIFEFIPLIGPLTVAVIVALTASFSDNPWVALYAIIFLIVLRICQDYVIYPRIIREGIHLHPLAIILSVLVGEQLAGIAGVFISIPVMALSTVLYKHILDHVGATGLVSGWLAPQENPVDETATTTDAIATTATAK